MISLETRDLARDLVPEIDVGEAASMEVERHEREFPARREVLPIEDTYYGLPAVKAPVWTWMIPAYFFAGGMSGGLSILGMAASLSSRPMPKLKRATHLVAVMADALSAVLLVVDLGRPSRFHHMLRVFRPTSPMSIGSWVLTFSGASNTAALLFQKRLVGKVGEFTAGVLGGPLAGYTAVLLTNTATPAWLGARRSLPFLFVASGIAAAGSLLGLLPLDPHEHRVARRFARIGRAAELAASTAVEIELSSNPRAKETLSKGVAGTCLRAARAATIASFAMSFHPNRKLRKLGDVIGLVGALAMRFGIVEAGKASTQDPRAAFDL